jgi:hypothetical protein
MSGSKPKTTVAGTPSKGSNTSNSGSLKASPGLNLKSASPNLRSEDDIQIPTLQYAGSERISSNFHQFAEALHSACSISYGNIAKIIKIDDWPMIPLPSKPDSAILSEIKDQEEADQLVEDWKEERKLVIRENAKIRGFASQMFSKIMLHLSEESKAAIKEAADWDAVELAEDPVRLWKIVKDTHLATYSSNKELDKLRSRNLYAIKQRMKLLQGLRSEL